MLLQEPNNTVGFGLKLLVTDFFGSRERHVWYAREEYRDANATQSPTLVDWDLIKDSRHLLSCQMTHVLNNIANQWQILVHFSSFAMSIWRLFLGQFWYE